MPESTPRQPIPPADKATRISSLPPTAHAQCDLVNAISVDNIIFGLDGGHLKVLLVRQTDVRHRGLWALPGGWIRRNEGLRDAAARVLADLTTLEDVYLDQLGAFGRVDRFPYDRVITVAYYALIRADQCEIATSQWTYDVKWHPVDETPALVYDHAEILSHALENLRNRIRHAPIGFELLPEKFTLGQLQTVYESVLGTKLDKPNFRRKILRMNIIRPCQEFQQDSRHRAAQLYQFDAELYRQYQQSGFT